MASLISWPGERPGGAAVVAESLVSSMYLSSSDACCTLSSSSVSRSLGELADGGAGGASDGEGVAVLAGDGGPLGAQRRSERAGLGERTRTDPPVPPPRKSATVACAISGRGR